MQGAAMYAGSAMPNSSQATQPQQQPTTQPQAPMQYQYITPSYYSNNMQADTTPMQGGQQIELPKNQGSSNMWNWGG